MSPFAIAGRPIDESNPCYIIAEISANHLQDFGRAKELVVAAAETGADAIKLQTYLPDSITLDCDKPEFQIGKGTIWEGKNLYQLYSEAYTPWEWHAELFELAKNNGVQAFSSPFDRAAVDFLEELDVPAYKVASFELIDIPLLEKIAETRKPTILSTGMASVGEIEQAVNIFRLAGVEYALLRTNSGYPTPPEEMKLANMQVLKQTFHCQVGLSDHTLGIAVPVAAVALGARIVEKHITTSREDGGPDAEFSLEIEEFSEMVKSIRISQAAVGAVDFSLTKKELSSKKFRRSLFAATNIEKGEIFSENNIRSIRPADGLPPAMQTRIIGKTAIEAIEFGTPIRLEHVDFTSK